MTDIWELNAVDPHPNPPLEGEGGNSLPPEGEEKTLMKEHP
jgi:hypothetical protein